MRPMEHPLQKFRGRAGLTVEALARQLGISKSSLSRIENGKQNPSLSLLRRINKITAGKVTANDFLPAQAERSAAA
jgi:transcriptional regulator with XRE-family HTH domain